jgi:hypothetical protein
MLLMQVFSFRLSFDLCAIVLFLMSLNTRSLSFLKIENFIMY